MARLSSSLALLLGLLALGRSAAAQCPNPDKLDGGPCCAIAVPNLPQFPNWTQDALEICWKDCNVSQTINYRARWKHLNVIPPGGVPCGEHMMNLDLYDAVGVLTWTGVFRFQYSRTWIESDPAGFPLQVWRFLINGDLSPTVATAVIPCPVPPCAPANNNRVRFSGYVDYALNCAVVPALFREAWMISHVCDFIDHHAGFPRAGAFHPDRAYSIVGPAAGFVPGPIQPTEGTPGSPFEAMRRRNFPPLGAVGPVTCNFEERLQFSLLPQQQFCLCGISPTAQWLIANLTITGACGSTVTTPGIPFLPGFMSMGIGSWTIPGIFPGVEAVRWNAGGYDYFEPCPPPTTRREVFYGATTVGGYPAFQLLSGGPAGPLPLTFIDQSNSLRPPGTLTIMNVPYVSDRFLNLNH